MTVENHTLVYVTFLIGRDLRKKVVGAVLVYIVCKSMVINMTTQHDFEVRVDRFNIYGI
jgi:hypothetical protein